MKTYWNPRVVVGALCLLAAMPLIAQDWPQWGGSNPNRNMFSSVKGLPGEFSPGKLKSGSDEADLTTTKNVRWVAKLGAQSYGNVTVTGGKVFIGTNNENPRDPNQTGDRSLLMCFDEKTGEFQWQLVIPKLAAGKALDWENLGLLSSPAVEGDRVYIISSRCEVLCLTTEGLAKGNVGPFKEEGQYMVGPGNLPAAPGPKDGDIVWRYNMLDELGLCPHNAANCSILIMGDYLYVSTANGQDWTHKEVPFPDAPSLIVLNKKTGQLVGEDHEQIAHRLFHGQWSSPSGAVVNGKPVIYFGGGDGVLYAFDVPSDKPSGGKFLKKLWWADCNLPEFKVKDGAPINYPDADGPSEINATPVFFQNRVYTVIGQDPENGEGVGRLVCFDATKSGDLTQTGVVWDYREFHRSLSTVSIDPATGLLFVADFSGFVYCLDAATGKHYWTHDLKAHVWGSTLVADGKVLVGDEDGDLCVLAATKEKKVIQEVNFGGPIYSTPVAANGTLFVSTQTHLYALETKR